MARRNEAGRRLHSQMIKLHGTTDGHLCRDCRHLKRSPRSMPPKCTLASTAVSVIWQTHWQACGRFEDLRNA